MNIWIVEDDAFYRRTLQRLLNREKNITCSRVFPSCIEFLEAVETDRHPDLVLMDLGLPGMGGVEGIRRLAKVAPDMTVLVLTVFEDKQKVVEALDAGAAGYLLKTASDHEILQGVTQVFLGGAALSPKIARVVVEEMRSVGPSETFGLTPREVDVLQKMAEDLSVKEIGAELGISRRTVATHLENIYRKLQVHSQSGAVAKALRSRII
ncbi:response regulator transcription factor [Tichowtungia aerotolerans]|uniref:Response regulator n=1 Tax=Tichowtungia aerotolerans TaxID=2697043 RepID=A0A6P1LZN2_9BACT|nr:response regulator transcription factor [Tichowtungia aerotolerans]QHI67999.1 response regulator [Tichowtungia aerotolerans]